MKRLLLALGAGAADGIVVAVGFAFYQRRSLIDRLMKCLRVFGLSARLRCVPPSLTSSSCHHHGCHWSD